MADIFSKQKRSEIMRKVKGKGNLSTEEKLVKIFKLHNIIGWKRNYPVKGKPDFVFLKKKIAVFADGCFWHGHHCRNIVPKNNATFWDQKREANKNRDINTTKYFESRGWTVLRIWECDIKNGNLDLSILL